MNKVKIEIIKLGESKHSATIKRLRKYVDSNKSKLFEITEIKKVNLPDSDIYSWGYSDNLLYSLISKTKTNADIQLGIIDYPIEGNFFGRELSDSVGIVSFHETDCIFQEANIDLLNFLLMTIYQAVVLYSCHKSIKDGQERLYHDESRGCIFDMCGLKRSIVTSASNPTICFSCEAILRQSALNEKFTLQLKKELKTIKKPLYYRIIDWVKTHPILSLLITVISTVVIGMITNAIYDIIKYMILGE